VSGTSALRKVQRIPVVVVAVALFSALSTTCAARAAVSHSPCAHPGVRESLFYSAPGAWLENLGFDRHGGLWVAEIRADQVVRLNARGNVLTSFPLSYPGAIEPGPDGMMYANFGDGPSSGTGGQAGVVRFRPRARTPKPHTFVSGLRMANGAAFDSAGNLYVSDTTNGGVTKFRPNGSIDHAWTRAAQIASANGLAVTGRNLYVAVTDDPDSTIYRVPLRHHYARGSR
jgi:virginiamycin B lyase